jgi:uncharacterized hydrophobic protein (TIGR00271 family)
MRLRVVSPNETAEQITALLAANPCVLNLAVLPAGARKPDGAALHCDVLTGALNDVLAGLCRLDVDKRGSIMVEDVELALCERAAEVESLLLGKRANAPVWRALDARIDADASYGPSFFLLLVIAGLIGAVGIITNSQILIVAAMVVGPEFGAIASVAAGFDRRAGATIRRGLIALAVGFLMAVIVTFMFSLVIRGLAIQPKAFELGVRPVSDLINTPNFFSIVVAVLAGIIGIVSLAQSRASALLGVFISVTTIPAAADIGVSCAFSSWSEARGSFFQLLLNVVLLIAVGYLTLRVQRAAWQRIERRERNGKGR